MAVTAFQEILKREPGSPVARYGLGNALVQAQELGAIDSDLPAMPGALGDRWLTFRTRKLKEPLRLAEARDVGAILPVHAHAANIHAGTGRELGDAERTGFVRRRCAAQTDPLGQVVDRAAIRRLRGEQRRQCRGSEVLREVTRDAAQVIIDFCRDGARCCWRGRISGEPERGRQRSYLPCPRWPSPGA